MMQPTNLLFRRLFTLMFLALSLTALAGDPIPDIEITVIQSGSGIEKSGTTNEKGELVLSGFEAGPCMVKITQDGRTRVVGQVTGKQIIIPEEEVAIKPIRLELPAHKAPAKGIGKGTAQTRMVQNHNSSRSNRTSPVALDTDDDGDGIGTGEDSNRAQNHNSSRSNSTSPVALDTDDDGDGIETAEEVRMASNHNTTRSNRISPVALNPDEDCNDTVEITPMADGRLRIVATCE